MQDKELAKLEKQLATYQRDLDLVEDALKRPYDVFISYSRDDYRKIYEKGGTMVEEVFPRDQNPILQITEKLTLEGLNVWYDQEGLSTEFIRYITEKIDNSKLMIFVSSYNSNYHSKWTPDEISYAKERKIPIIVFMIDAEKLNKQFRLALSSLNRIENYPSNPTQSLGELLTCVRETLSQLKNDKKNLQQRIKSVKEEMEVINQAMQIEQERVSLRADYDKAIADVTTMEASANSKRMEVISKLHQLPYEDIKQEYVDSLDRSGILHQKEKEAHQREEEAKKEVSRKKRQLVILAFSGGILLAILLIVIGWQTITHQKQVSDIEKQKDSIKYERDSIFSLKEQLSTELQDLQNQNAGAYIRGPKDIILLNNTKGQRTIPIESNAGWEVKNVPSNAFYKVQGREDNVILSYEANNTTKERDSKFQVALKHDKTKATEVRIRQKASTDTIIALSEITPIIDEHGIKIKYPVQINYIQGKATVQAKFYNSEKQPINAKKTNESKGYRYDDPKTGVPKLCSKEITLECTEETGSTFESLTIFVPKEAYYDKPYKAEIIFRQGKKTIKTFEYICQSI